MLCSVRILKTLCRKLKLPEDFDYQHLARLTPGYVGADLMALCREAVMSAVNRLLFCLMKGKISDKALLTSEVPNEAAGVDEEVSDQSCTAGILTGPHPVCTGTDEMKPSSQKDSGHDHLQVSAAALPSVSTTFVKLYPSWCRCFEGCARKNQMIYEKILYVTYLIPLVQRCQLLLSLA